MTPFQTYRVTEALSALILIQTNAKGLTEADKSNLQYAIAKLQTALAK